jgi:hypothetical protein
LLRFTKGGVSAIFLKKQHQFTAISLFCNFYTNIELMSFEILPPKSRPTPDKRNKERAGKKEKYIAVSNDLPPPEGELAENQEAVEYQREVIRYALLGAFNEDFWNAVPFLGISCNELMEDIPEIREEVEMFLNKKIRLILSHRDFYEEYASVGNFENCLIETREAVKRITKDLTWGRALERMQEKIPVESRKKGWWPKFTKASKWVLDEASSFEVFELFLNEEGKPHLVNINEILRDYLRLVSNIGAFKTIREGSMQIRTSFAENLPNVLVKINEILEVLLLTSLHAGRTVEFQGVMNITTNATQREIIITFSTPCEIKEEEISIYDKNLGERELIRRWLLSGSIYSLMAFGFEPTQKILQSYSGRLEVMSQLGYGSRFTLTLPTVEDKEKISL